jgi:ubiquinone/menaquinone biosynthesis C-methylase UbiE
MPIDLAAYRASDNEQARVASLLRLVPSRGHVALDVGARDGYVAQLLAQRFDAVVALDVERLRIDHARVLAVQADARSLPFPDDSFDLVLCAEVLEHIAAQDLGRASAEIIRVARGTVVIGVPYRQDTRVGRTICPACHRDNPPWGHVNSFKEQRLIRMFGALRLVGRELVGSTKDFTNAASSRLMACAGHPYGTYGQEEPCVHCGARLAGPPGRSAMQRLATKAAVWIDKAQRAVTPPRARWMHLQFAKNVKIATDRLRANM